MISYRSECFTFVGFHEDALYTNYQLAINQFAVDNKIISYLLFRLIMLLLWSLSYSLCSYSKSVVSAHSIIVYKLRISKLHEEMCQQRLQFSLSIFALLGLFFFDFTVYVVLDISFKQESVVLIFHRDIRYFHHGQE